MNFGWTVIGVGGSLRNNSLFPLPMATLVGRAPLRLG